MCNWLRFNWRLRLWLWCRCRRALDGQRLEDGLDPERLLLLDAERLLLFDLDRLTLDWLQHELGLLWLADRHLRWLHWSDTLESEVRHLDLLLQWHLNQLGLDELGLFNHLLHLLDALLLLRHYDRCRLLRGSWLEALHQLRLGSLNGHCGGGTSLGGASLGSLLRLWRRCWSLDGSRSWGWKWSWDWLWSL